jgi:hypothetical protein
MVHHRQRLALRLEPRDDLLGIHPQLDDLERHPPPHRLGLLRHIDHAAAAFAHAFQQFVAPERLADGFIGSIGKVELDGGPRGFGLRGQQCFRLLVRGEQGVEAGAEGRIAFAFGVEPRRAFRGGLVQRQLEQDFFGFGFMTGMRKVGTSWLDQEFVAAK